MSNCWLFTRSARLRPAVFCGAAPTDTTSLCSMRGPKMIAQPAGRIEWGPPFHPCEIHHRVGLHSSTGQPPSLIG
eukprot:3128885-Pyramimonas_sp.AAC.1